MTQPLTTKFWSALEPVSMILAFLIAGIAVIFYNNTFLNKAYLGISLGTITLLMALLLTHYTFEASEDRVTYGTLFWSRSIPLADIIKVDAFRSRSIVRGTIIRFKLTPVEVNGQLTGRGEIVSVGRWPLPDAAGWLATVNSLAAERRKHAEQ